MAKLYLGYGLCCEQKQFLTEREKILFSTVARSPWGRYSNNFPPDCL